MKRISVLLLSAAVAFLSCSTPAVDYRQQSVMDEIQRLVGEGAKLKMALFEVTDSCSYADELDYRKRLFALKLKKDEEFYLKSTFNGNQPAMAKYHDALMNDHRISKGIDSLAVAIEPFAGQTAYYICHFSGTATDSTTETAFKDYYAAVTPSGEVKRMLPQRDGLRKTMGSVIPGYQELLKGEEDE